MAHSSAQSSAMLSGSAGSIELRETVRAGLLGGLVGGVIIWIYEAIVWVGVQHLMPMAGIPRNATGLVFRKDVQDSLGALAFVVGTGIHFFFALAWAWPLRWRGRCSPVAAMRRRWLPCSSRCFSGS